MTSSAKGADMQKHGLRKVAAALVLAGVLTLMVASSAFADSYVFNNGYRAEASAQVYINRVNHTMTLRNISASAMAKIPYYSSGYTPGVFDKGQPVRYDVQTRVNYGGWTTLYSWSNWILIKGMTVTPGTSLYDPLYNFYQSVLNPRNIVISGRAGHTYQVRVQVAWYTGYYTSAYKIYPVNVTPTYFVYAYTWYAGYLGWHWMHPSSAAF